LIVGVLVDASPQGSRRKVQQYLINLKLVDSKYHIT